MIVIIDNYDSFTYNLYQMVGALSPDVRVIRNDALTVEELERLAPSHIIISPGPGRPEAAGISESLIRHLASRAERAGRAAHATRKAPVPLLGVCLGHQAICEVFGATITYALHLMHGKSSELLLANDSLLFAGLPERIQGARYHSLVADPATIPAELKVTAHTVGGEVMAVEHRELPIYGVQFHPESVLTPQGAQILANFLHGQRAHRTRPIEHEPREHRQSRSLSTLKGLR